MNKNLTFILFISTWLVFILIRWNWDISFFSTAYLGYILTIATLMFSFLVGYYLNSRYNRYITVRDSHILRHSKCLNILESCRAFSDGKELLKELYKRLNAIALIDELTSWEEGYIEEPYFKKLYDLIGMVKIVNAKDKELFKILLILIHDVNDLTRKINAIGRDTLGFFHWVLLGSLASIIILLTLSIPVSSVVAIIILMMLPLIVLLSIYIIYGYQNLLFIAEATFMEINQKIFDEIGKKRFYKKSRLHFVRPSIRDDKRVYRTEDKLKDEDKDVYLDYLDKEFYVDRVNKEKIHY